MQTNKLREALEATKKFLESAITDGKVTAQDITALLNIVSAARSEPVRNCDVGTAEMQAARFAEYCEKCDGGRCDHRLFKAEEVCGCFARWLQKPYEAEKGGDK